MTPGQSIALWELLCTSPKAFAKTIPMFIGVRWLRQTPNVETLYSEEQYQAARMAVEFLRRWADQLEIALTGQEAYHREHDKRWSDDETATPKGKRSKTKAIAGDSLDGL